MEYALEEPPEFLTFMARFGGENAALPSVMEVNVKQEGAGTPQAAKLEAGQPHTVRLDWDNPPLSATASQQEWEHWADKTREKTLGITSYSSIYSFIYITDHEVRHEILIPLLTLETWFPIQRKQKEFLEVEEQEAARDKIEDFFGQGNPVAIDGMEVEPVIERVEHWGHIHSRTNEYQALFSVEPIENSWKITGLEPIDQRRLKLETSLRTAE